MSMDTSQRNINLAPATDVPEPGSAVRVTNADSPYTVNASDSNIFCATDTGAIVVNLPAGQANEEHRIINTGTSANNVTVNPNGAELLLGSNSSITALDADVVIIAFQTIEGWW